MHFIDGWQIAVQDKYKASSQFHFLPIFGAAWGNYLENKEVRNSSISKN